jgi:hypothetical protein
MTKEEDKERLSDSEVAADEVAHKAAQLRARLQAAIDARKGQAAPRVNTQVPGLFSSNVGEEDSEGITPDEMATPFPEAMLAANDPKMNSTMFGLPSLGDSEVSSAEGLEQPSRVDTRMVSGDDLPAELFEDAEDEWELEPIEDEGTDAFEIDPRFDQPTYDAEAFGGAVFGAPTFTDREREAVVASREGGPSALMLAESESSWAVEDIDLDGELPGEEPEPPEFELDLEPGQVPAPSPTRAPAGPAPADADMGGPGVYIHRKVGKQARTRDSGLHKLSKGDLDELFSSSAPGLRAPGARQEHSTPGAVGVAELAEALVPGAAAEAAASTAAEQPLECSLMFSRGGEPVSSVAVDEGFVQALLRFALDYAAARTR